MPIILSPSNAPLTTLVPDLRKRLHCLTLNVIDEPLAVLDTFITYQGENKQWIDFPNPVIRKIDETGAETLLIPTTDYTLDLDNGKVTLVVSANPTDFLVADYTFDVFTDDELSNFLEQSAREVRVLIHRKLDVASIPDDYKEAILKRAFTNAFKCLLEPTFNFFNVTVLGRTIDKAMLVDSITKIMEENEKLLTIEINSLRNFNQTNRFE